MPKAKKTVAKVADSPFIIATLQDARMLEEDSKFLLDNVTSGQALAVQVQSSYNVQVAIGTDNDRPDSLTIFLALGVKIGKQDQPSESVAHYNARHVHTYRIARIVGNIDPDAAIPLESIQPYTQLGTIAMVARARDTLGRMGLPNVPIQLPDDFKFTGLENSTK